MLPVLPSQVMGSLPQVISDMPLVKGRRGQQEGVMGIFGHCRDFRCRTFQ